MITKVYNKDGLPEADRGGVTEKTWNRAFCLWVNDRGGKTRLGDGKRRQNAFDEKTSVGNKMERSRRTLRAMNTSEKQFTAQRNRKG